jgi:hypothetical protein
VIPALIRSVACSNGHFKGYWQQLSSSYELLLPVAVCSESRSEAGHLSGRDRASRCPTLGSLADASSGLVHTAGVTSGNVHDAKLMDR